MRRLTVREIALALFTFALGVVTPSVLQAAERNPFQVVDGDGWLTSNADYGTGAWTALNAARPAFGLQLSERNDLPFDRGTAGATFWVHNAGCTPAFESFGNPCGWQLGLAVTQFRSIVVGGNGMEIDGLDAPAPYARVVNASDGGMRVAGLLTNAYVDFSGVDSASAPSWFSGFELDRDAYAVRRAAPGSSSFADLLTLDRDGDAAVSGSFTSARSLQSAPNQWATRAQLLHGSYTFRYAKPFARPPVCIATPEGSARVRVTPSADTCTVTSENPHDATMVDIVVVGNPS
ncbi:MAG TPA: hypothetical protein VMA98_08100 [Candidatus Acidoferrales bacterium]|nr:hypothetical protein [Candidatus Acidoferrales bacterium]